MKFRHALRKTRRLLHRWAWVVIASLATIAFVAGVIGFKKYLTPHDLPSSLFDIIYKTLQLFTLESGAVPGPLPFELQLARFLAPAATASALARACWAVFERQISELRLRFSRNHVVICGLGHKGSRLAEEICQTGTRVIVIENDLTNTGLAQCRDQGAFILNGSASDPWMLAKARVDRAAKVIAVTGDDGTNVEAAVHAFDLSQKRSGAPLKCMIHVVDPRLQECLRDHEVFNSRLHKFEIRIFNVFETGAEAMLEELRMFRQSDGSESPHLVIIGFGRLGEAVLSSALQFWQATCQPPLRPMKVTIIDRKAIQKTSHLAHAPAVQREACELHVKDMEVASPEFERGDFILPGFSDPTSICVCFDSDSQALAAALAMHDLFRTADVPIVVRMKENAGLASVLGTARYRRGVVDGIRAVGMLDLACTIDRILD